MKRTHFFICSALVLLFTSCSGKNTEQEEFIEIEKYANDHRWYYFTQDGFEPTRLPQKAGISSLKPWTETLRISDANTSLDSQGFMVVNRLGILLFNGKGEPVLLQDKNLFSDATAGNLVFSDGNAYFSLTRNSFFNKEAGKAEAGENRPYLIRISDKNKSLLPAVTYGDLQLENGEEVTGNYFDGSNWLASIKRTYKNRTEFRYIEWKPSQTLSALSPVTKEGKVRLSESSEGTFRSANTMEKYTQSPRRLRELLKSIPSDFDFTVTVKDAGGISPRYYSNINDKGTTSANAIIADKWICTVFADGTSYFAGALKNRANINNGKNVAFRLPKLPKNYIYGSFCISDGFMVVAWEESDFYKTGRSGFLVVDLANLFYNELPQLR